MSFRDRQEKNFNLTGKIQEALNSTSDEKVAKSNNTLDEFVSINIGSGCHIELNVRELKVFGPYIPRVKEQVLSLELDVEEAENPEAYNITQIIGDNNINSTITINGVTINNGSVVNNMDMNKSKTYYLKDTDIIIGKIRAQGQSKIDIKNRKITHCTVRTSGQSNITISDSLVKFTRLDSSGQSAILFNNCNIENNGLSTSGQSNIMANNSETRSNQTSISGQSKIIGLGE